MADPDQTADAYVHVDLQLSKHTILVGLGMQRILFNPFPLTANPQQTKISSQKDINSINEKKFVEKS